MRFEEDRLPRCGPTAKTLGARPGATDGDIPVDGTMVLPGTGGMSVSPPPAENIPEYRRPPEHGGTAKKVRLFELETDELPGELRARPDPQDPERHVFIEPAREMSFDEYSRAIEGIRHLWRPV